MNSYSSFSNKLKTACHIAGLTGQDPASPDAIMTKVLQYKAVWLSSEYLSSISKIRNLSKMFEIQRSYWLDVGSVICCICNAVDGPTGQVKKVFVKQIV